MNAVDWYAVAWDGDVYCADCLPDGVGVEDDGVYPIFADSEWDRYPVCCVCGAEHDYVGLIEHDDHPADGGAGDAGYGV